MQEKNGFAYIEFYNENSGKSTNGWIKLIDFEDDSDLLDPMRDPDNN